MKFWDTGSSSIIEVAETHLLKLALGTHLERQGDLSKEERIQEVVW